LRNQRPLKVPRTFPRVSLESTSTERRSLKRTKKLFSMLARMKLQKSPDQFKKSKEFQSKPLRSNSKEKSTNSANKSSKTLRTSKLLKKLKKELPPMSSKFTPESSVADVDRTQLLEFDTDALF